MESRYDDDVLARMEEDAQFNSNFGSQIGRSFRKAMNLVRNIAHEGELVKFKGLRSEKLKGDRQHQWSLRLNDQWRLVYEIEKHDGGNVFVTKEIADYH